MEINGITHPIPERYAKRIYDLGKNVFVGKSFLRKAKKGDKFIIYESRGEKAYTGWGEIVFIGKMKPNDIIKKYKDNLMITTEELKEYSKGKTEMTVIEFENFRKFKNPIIPKRFVSIGGKYIYKDEYETIMNNIG